jgi:ribonuclease HI
MTVKITLGNECFDTDKIIWDRDSFFINFNSYWTRLTGTFAQMAAERTTKNWSSFNMVRTEVIKILGIDPASSKLLSLSSPVKIMPVNFYPFIITPFILKITSDYSSENITDILKEVLIKSLNECSKHLNESTVEENIRVFKNLNRSANILITNDSHENNLLFLKASGLESSFQNIFPQKNKDELIDLLTDNSLFITDNDFLKNSYKKRGFDNVLITDNLDKLSISVNEEKSIIIINIDGASRGNPGPSAVGVVFKNGIDTIHEISEYIGNHTNNFAEYTALIKALEISLEKDLKKIEVKSDSELVVKQINKIYKVKDADIKVLFDKASELINKFSDFKITHIPREENLKADKLANNALNFTLQSQQKHL